MGEPNEKANIILGFFCLFRGFRFNKYNLGKYFDSTLKVRMFNPDVNIPADLRDLLIKIVV